MAGRVQKLSHMDRARILGQAESGMSYSEIARQFGRGITHVTVGRIVKRFNDTGDVVDRPRSGRPRCTSHAQDHFIETTVARNRFLTGKMRIVLLSCCFEILLLACLIHSRFQIT